ncbi:MAG: type II toxin-antitoxin system Phd/YefM family antitoxin [Candidatus Saccharimonadales bacterium]
MNKVITIYDAKTNLSKYIKQAKTGTPVYIGSYGEQEVVLMSATPDKAKIKLGTAAGKFKYSESALEGIDEDVQTLFYGKG